MVSYVEKDEKFTLNYLRDNLGLLAKGDWQEVIFGLDPEDILMFESLVNSGDIFKNKARIRLSTIHTMKGAESENVVVISDISFKTWKKLMEEPEQSIVTHCCESTRNLYICRWIYYWS
jgi:hypothetical protein